MEFIFILLTALAVLLIVNIILTIKAGKKEANNELAEIKSSIGTLTSNLKDTEKNLKDEFVTNRKESSDIAAGLRLEIGTQLNIFTQTFLEQLSNLTSSNELKFDTSRKTIEDKLMVFQTSIDSNSKESRKELKLNLEDFQTNLNDAFAPVGAHANNN